MARIVDYKVAYAGSDTNIEDRVRPMLRDGWQPFGSLVVVIDRGALIEAQPMVRYEELVPAPKQELPPGVTLVESILPGENRP